MTNAREATRHLNSLLRREREAMSEFLLALAAFDEKRLWLELGHASLFSFLRRELGLSAGAAQYRKTAAELVRRHPEVERALREGKLCLSSVVELAKVLTAENVTEVLPRFFGLSSREAAAVAVSIRPVEHAPVREVVTPLRPPAAVEPPALLTPVAANAAPPAFDRRQEPVRAPEPAACASTARAIAAPRAAVDPLDADHARLHLTVSRRLLAKLDAAKAALSHVRPGATSEQVLEAALDALLAQHAKRRGIVAKPRSSSGDAQPRSAANEQQPRPANDALPRPVNDASAQAANAEHPGAAAQGAERRAIPAAVRRAAWTRAGGRCEWPLESGGRCNSTLRLEFDHVVPHARGGGTTIDNVRVVCRVHNDLAARRAFGDAWMDLFTQGERACR